MDTQAMHDVSVATEQGRMTFPQVVGRLLEAGVESYLVDFAAGKKTHYLTNGETYTEEMTAELEQIANEFSLEELVAAIRGAQADTVRYPEFVRLATAAGAIGYWAFLMGKRVVYFGRKGEIHVEEFPKSKQ